MTTYRYRNPEKRRAYMREVMRARRLWTRKDRDAAFFREWVRIFVSKVIML